MLLLTNIPPRRTGEVRVRMGETESRYIFLPNAQGDLVCEVPDDGHVATLLSYDGQFEPYDEADHARAEQLLLGSGLVAPAEPEDEPPSSDPNEGAELVNGGLPIEANTPPVNNKRKRTPA